MYVYKLSTFFLQRLLIIKLGAQSLASIGWPSKVYNRSLNKMLSPTTLVTSLLDVLETAMTCVNLILVFQKYNPEFKYQV